jgi:hypothetical protein
MGRGLQLLRKKADQIGARNAFNDVRREVLQQNIGLQATPGDGRVGGRREMGRYVDREAAIRVGVARRYHQALAGVQPAAGRVRNADNTTRK